MHIIHYLKHLKNSEILFDYYEETEQGVVNYVLKADGKVIYKEPEDLDDLEIAKLVQQHLNVLTSSKYNEPKKESAPSSVLPMTL